MRRLVFGLPALLAMAVPSAAQAQHELHGHMSAAGVEYLETAIPTALPEQLLLILGRSVGRFISLNI